jgi:peptidoglycan hydrolase-like protein with peptidoglycan-binding domain
MKPNPKCIGLGFAIACLTSAAFGADLNPAAINSAVPSSKTLSNDNPTPAGIRLQVLLDKAHFSPGEIDGKFGENAKKALRAYADAQQLPSGDAVSADVWTKASSTCRAKSRESLTRVASCIMFQRRSQKSSKPSGDQPSVRVYAPRDMAKTV